MYNDYRDLSIVYPSTMKKFIDELNRKNCWLDDKHQDIFEKLMSSRVKFSKYYFPAQCEFENLKKESLVKNVKDGWR